MYSAQQVSKTVENNYVIYTFCVYKDGVVEMKDGEPHQFVFGVSVDAEFFEERVSQYVQHYLKKLCNCATPMEAPDFGTITQEEEE